MEHPQILQNTLTTRTKIIKIEFLTCLPNNTDTRRTTLFNYFTLIPPPTGYIDVKGLNPSTFHAVDHYAMYQKKGVHT